MAGTLESPSKSEGSNEGKSYPWCPECKSHHLEDLVCMPPLTTGEYDSNKALHFSEVKKFEANWAALREEEETTHNAKRLRYTGGRDPLDNYRASSEVIAKLLELRFPEAAAYIRELKGIPAMLVREFEKFQRILTMTGQEDFFNTAQGEDEPTKDTYVDISVIAKLLEIETERVREAHHEQETK